MLEQLIEWLAYGSLFIGALSAYLHLNKLWSRKHIPEVAASISISGTLLEAVPTIIFGLYFVTRRDPVGTIDSLIWLTAAVGFIMIGSGYWVKGQRRTGLLQLAWRSIRSEGQEVGNLAGAILHPESSKELVALLQSLAEVDGEISAGEVSLIAEIANEMNVTVDIQPRQIETSRAERLLNIREALGNYLLKSPPRQSVEQLGALLQRLAVADDEEHEDENAALAEIRGLLGRYIQDDDSDLAYRVLIAPQSEEQIRRISTLLRGSELHDRAGGRGVTVGEYHTREYADTVCREYRGLGFFCVVTDDLSS